MTKILNLIMDKILLTSVCILQFCGIDSASAGELTICGHSKYGFDIFFTRVANNLGYDVTISHLDECELQTILLKSVSDVVVYFDIVNPEDYDSTHILNQYDGDVIAEHYGIINKTLPSCSADPNQTDGYKRICGDPDFNAYTKLFIGSFEEHQALYNVYNAITNNLIAERGTTDNFAKEIVVCLDHEYSCPPNETGFTISCKSCDTQFECSENIIAVIAPSPEKLKTCNENIPVIFYDTVAVKPNNVRTVYDEQYTSDFIASTTMIHWKALSSSLRKYLNRHSWPRVAIVSDDSQLSHYMTHDQEEYFKDVKALFTSIRDCTEARDFKKALTFLNKFESRVIIVNVVKQNLNKFIQGAKAAAMTDADIIWVFPGHKETDIKHFKFKSFVYLTCDRNEVVQFVIKKYKESLGVETKFKEKIKANRPLESCDHHQWPPICSIMVKSTPNTLPFIGQGSCALRTSNYFYYCADWHVLYMILAIIVFLLLVFAVLLFFNHIQMKTLAYKPLHEHPPLWRQLLRRGRPPPRQGFLMRRRF